MRVSVISKTSASLPTLGWRVCGERLESKDGMEKRERRRVGGVGGRHYVEVYKEGTCNL